MRTEAWLYLLIKKCIQIRSEFHKSQSSQFQNWDKRNWNRCSTKIDLPTVLKHLIILFLECLAVFGDRSAKYWTEWNSNVYRCKIVNCICKKVHFKCLTGLWIHLWCILMKFLCHEKFSICSCSSLRLD